MPDETTDPPLDIPDARPFIIGGMAACALIATAARHLITQKSNDAGWDALVADPQPTKVLRVWTSAFSETDPFLAQLKDITTP